MQKVISKKEIEKIVSNKKPLTEKSLKLKELQELKEGLQNLDEASFGEKLKYYAAKWLPSYKVGDKIFGSEKERQKMLNQIQAIIDSETQNGQDFINSLHNSLPIKYPDFPNNLEKEDFLKGVLEISAVYDTIKKAVDDGKIKVGAADIYIDNLRKYVNYVMSYQLNRTIYSTMNENYDESEDIQLGEATMADINKDGGLSSDSVRRALGRDREARKGVGNAEFDSEVMKGLKSNRLPLTLGIAGAVLTAAGFIGQAQWFIDYIKGLKEIDVWHTQDIIEKNIKIDPRGLSYTLQNNIPSNQAINLNFNQPVGNLKEAINFYGNGDMKKGIEIISNFIDPNQRAESIANLTKQLADPSNRTIGDIFNTAEGTYGRAGTLFSQYGGAKSVLAKFFINRIKHTLIKQGAGAAVGSALIAAAPYLAPIGITAMIAGAVVKAMRVKGQTSSRAATLNALLQSLRPLSVQKQVDGQPPVDQGDSQPPVDQGDGQPPVDQGDGKQPTDQGDGKKKERKPRKKSPTGTYNLSKVLRNLFIDVADIRSQQGKNLTTEANNLSKKYLKTKSNLDKQTINTFVQNMKRMVAVTREINKINLGRLEQILVKSNKVNSKLISDVITDMSNISGKRGPLHNVLSNIGMYFSDSSVKKYPDFMKNFIMDYSDALKSTDFKNLQAEIDKNKDTLFEA